MATTNSILDDVFSILNQGVAAINAAKKMETGSGATNMAPINPVQLTPTQRAAQSSSRMWLWIAGIGVAAFGAWFFFRKRA